ncbi:MAG TPA: glycosyltransferase [Terriglobia bacterium]|nr:glycosyltransferase [Terriglobia bacterium]
MKISVIICTRNRAHAIEGSLDSVAAAIAAAGPVEAEIVVVDNASDDDTAERVRGWASRNAVPVNLQYETQRGLCFARNCGLRAARGELIAFTDDDCRWSETYVQEWLAHVAQDRGPVLRGGRVELGDPSDMPITVKTSMEKVTWSLDQKSARFGTLGLCIIGCNMTMSRALIERVGPFDVRFTSKGVSGADDTDLVYRCYLAGIPIEYVPDMVVYHYHGRKTQEQAYKLMSSYMIGSGALYAKYIFKNIDLIRPAVWDARLAVKEWLHGGNDLLPEFNFSYRTQLYYWLVGAWRYYTQPFRRA